MTNFLSHARGPHVWAESQFVKRIVRIRWTSGLSADRIRPVRCVELTREIEHPAPGRVVLKQNVRAERSAGATRRQQEPVCSACSLAMPAV